MEKPDLSVADLFGVFVDEFIETAETNELKDDAVVARFEHDRQQLDDVLVTQRVHLRLTLQPSLCSEHIAIDRRWQTSPPPPIPGIDEASKHCSRLTTNWYRRLANFFEI